MSMVFYYSLPHMHNFLHDNINCVECCIKNILSVHAHITEELCDIALTSESIPLTVLTVNKSEMRIEDLTEEFVLQECMSMTEDDINKEEEYFVAQRVMKERLESDQPVYSQYVQLIDKSKERKDICDDDSSYSKDSIQNADTRSMSDCTECFYDDNELAQSTHTYLRGIYASCSYVRTCREHVTKLSLTTEVIAQLHNNYGMLMFIMPCYSEQLTYDIEDIVTYNLYELCRRVHRIHFTDHAPYDAIYLHFATISQESVFPVNFTDYIRPYKTVYTTSIVPAQYERIHSFNSVMSCAITTVATLESLPEKSKYKLFNYSIYLPRDIPMGMFTRFSDYANVMATFQHQLNCLRNIHTKCDIHNVYENNIDTFMNAKVAIFYDFGILNAHFVDVNLRNDKNAVEWLKDILDLFHNVYYVGSDVYYDHCPKVFLRPIIRFSDIKEFNLRQQANINGEVYVCDILSCIENVLNIMGHYTTNETLRMDAAQSLCCAFSNPLSTARENLRLAFGMTHRMLHTHLALQMPYVYMRDKHDATVYIRHAIHAILIAGHDNCSECASWYCTLSNKTYVSPQSALYQFKARLKKEVEILSHIEHDKILVNCSKQCKAGGMPKHIHTNEEAELCIKYELYTLRTHMRAAHTSQDTRTYINVQDFVDITHDIRDVFKQTTDIREILPLIHNTIRLYYHRKGLMKYVPDVCVNTDILRKSLLPCASHTQDEDELLSIAIELSIEQYDKEAKSSQESTSQTLSSYRPPKRAHNIDDTAYEPQCKISKTQKHNVPTHKTTHTKKHSAADDDEPHISEQCVQYNSFTINAENRVVNVARAHSKQTIISFLTQTKYIDNAFPDKVIYEPHSVDDFHKTQMDTQTYQHIDYIYRKLMEEPFKYEESYMIRNNCNDIVRKLNYMFNSSDIKACDIQNLLSDNDKSNTEQKRQYDIDEIQQYINDILHNVAYYTCHVNTDKMKEIYENIKNSMPLICEYTYDNILRELKIYEHTRHKNKHLVSIIVHMAAELYMCHDLMYFAYTKCQ